MSMPLLIDCFMYNGDPIVIARLKYLYDTVDHFVIVEARKTFSGSAKPHMFFEHNKDQFAPYLDKIIYLTVDAFPPPTEEWLNTTARKHSCFIRNNTDAWWREMYQRAYAEQFVRAKFADQPYIVIVSDADEIPRILPYKQYIYNDLDEPVFLEMDFFYYNFSWIKKYKWYHPFIVNHRCDISWNSIRIEHPRRRLIPSAGWHCSYFFRKDDLRRKIESFSHREFDLDTFKTDEHLEKCLTEGRDIFDRGEHEDLIWNRKIAEIPHQLHMDPKTT